MEKTLKQFYCDTCGQIINNPEEGYVEWIKDYDTTNLNHSFKIVHHKLNSPLNSINGCYVHSNKKGIQSKSLTKFTGKNNMSLLLSFLDIGPDLESIYTSPKILDMREFVEFFRRLTIPNYEEARRYWDRASSEGFFDGNNETNIYTQNNLIEIINKYKP